MRKIVMLSIVILLAAVNPSHAGTEVKFQWDAHSQAAQIDGFKLYGGPAGSAKSLEQTIDGGTSTVTSLMVEQVGERCFHLTAFKDALESAPSNEVCAQLPPIAPGGLKVSVEVKIEMSN